MKTASGSRIPDPAVVNPDGCVDGSSAHPIHRVLIVSDAWHPQVNGVVRTIEWLLAEAPALGVEISLLSPDLFRSFPAPTYPEIRLTITTPARLAEAIDSIAPAAIHIATEGPLGFLARHYCLRRGLAFTTCYHTRFPEYLAARAPVPLSWTYAALRRFHAPAGATLVATKALSDELSARGFSNLRVWKRGIDVDLFRSGSPAWSGLPRPIALFVGRVAVEKNIEAFLSLDMPGTKIVVGEGPERLRLMQRYPHVAFPGLRTGQELADLYACADVFVFPSRTDTFGLVMLEAMAAGTPVAALPVAGPQDVIGQSGCGIMSEDLRAAVTAALTIPREKCRAYAAQFSMRVSAANFLSHLSKIDGKALMSPA
jgi:glycosyltransferase involved in cell wall biosynthesis